MNPIPLFCRGAAQIALALTLTVAPVAAQEVAPPPTPNADLLAEEMRVLARDPRNVRALLSAGELSARLNDPSAAAGFFARAQALDPGNPRVRAGQAMVMVRMERPGEALRLFAEAVRGGLAIDDYASDRGLAYDLIGAQAHAQLDHRLAMRRDPDDETRRRFALSLGISGNSKEAMEVLDPLLKRSDRAAWRARAFIMAMNGDAAGADKIAASMMGGFGTALSPFFRRLPTLAAADKAFAVHFGELRRTPARIADASSAPPLPALRAQPPVAVASAQMPQPPLPAARDRRVGEAPRRPSAAGRRETARVAAAAQARELEARRQTELQAAQQREAQRLAELKAQQEREALAARQRETERLAAEQAAREAEARRVAERETRERAAAAEAARVREAQQVAQTPPPATAPVTRDPVPDTPPVTRSQVAEAPPPTPVEAAPARAAATSPARPAVGREDNVIARIIAGITIPASELGVDPMPGAQRAEAEPAQQPMPAPTPAPAPTTTPVEVARAAPALPKPVAQAARPEPAARDKGAAEAKASTARTRAADAKAAAAKAKAKPDPAKAEPSRQWVQVAGGANVGDLPRTWRALVAKAPAEFRGKQGWTTPLRFTNRLLAGPFKTAAEAQAFVNAIGRKGLSAFTFTSEAGQKIEKLPTN
jgi:hypothetical protein